MHQELVEHGEIKWYPMLDQMWIVDIIQGGRSGSNVHIPVLELLRNDLALPFDIMMVA